MPRGSKPTYYWDACIFLAWLQDEVRAPGEMDGVSEVASVVSRGEANLVTSVMTRTEVLESSLTAAARRKFDEIFKRSNIYQLDVTQSVSSVAHEIRDHYHRIGRNVKTPDATHLATAITHKVTEFQTFDNKMLNLNGNVAGYPLSICKPNAIQGELF